MPPNPKCMELLPSLSQYARYAKGPEGLPTQRVGLSLEALTGHRSAPDRNVLRV